jgi:hypothetical protein
MPHYFEWIVVNKLSINNKKTKKIIFYNYYIVYNKMKLYKNKLFIINICLIIILLIAVNFSCYKSLKESFTQNVQIPKVIWTYWNTIELPEFIQNCITTWKNHNPDWTINILNDDNIKDYLDVDINQYKFIDSHTRKSDIIRCMILAKYGGVWSDASIIMYKSIENLPLNQYDFVGYYIDKFTSNSDYPVIENWFFACIPGCKFMNLWKDAFLSINDYDSVESYIKFVQSTTNLQKIEGLEYLAMHVAAQYVLQHKISKEEIKQNMYLLKAEDGPFKYLVENNWENEKAVKSICNSDKSNIIFYKLRGVERPYANNLPCLFDI